MRRARGLEEEGEEAGGGTGYGLTHAVSQAVKATGATDAGTGGLSSFDYPPGVTVTQELGHKTP